MTRNLMIVAAVVAILGSTSSAQSGNELLQQALSKEQAEGNLQEAIAIYQRIVNGSGHDRSVVATALVRMAGAYDKLGQSQARAIYERVVREFADQREAAATARARLGGTNMAEPTRGDRAVWNGGKVDLFGRVSPDGRFISFTDWATFNNLSLFDLRTNTDRALTGNKGWYQDDPKNWGEAQWSAVSPDGQYVAYHWLNERLNEVRIMPVEGAVRQPRTLLTSNAGGVRDWSPDGKLLAIGIEPGDGTMRIGVATVADGSMRVLKTTPNWRGANAMFFSRDSRYLAYDLPASDDEDENQRDVFILAVDGSREVLAVADAADDRVAGWSPDGRFLLFSSSRTGARSLWALPVSEGRPQGQPVLAKTDIGSSISLGVTDSGTLYLHKYVSSRDVKIARIDLDAGTIGPPTHFSQGLLTRPMTPHWSPDGKFVAYQVRGEEEGLAIRSVETGEVRRMRNLQYVADPRWSPDGRSLIAQTSIKGRRGVFRIDAQSGKATLIVQTESAGSYPRWSADGRRIYYVARRPFGKERYVRERHVDSGVERDVFTNPTVHVIELSPDGRQLAVKLDDQASRTTSIWIVPVAGGEPRELVSLSAGSSVLNAWAQMAWTPDSRRLLTARRSGKVMELWLIDVNTGNARKLDIDVSDWTLTTEGQGPAAGFALSPDGRSIAFLMGKSSAEVWAMENFLPAPKASR